MNDSKLKLLVSEAVKLDRQIEQLSRELAAHKAALVAEAETRAEDATPTEGGGTSITFEGADGCIARVTTAGATLKSSIKPESRAIEKIKTAARSYFARLFNTELTYRPVDNFRSQADELLGKDASKLIKLVTNPGKTTVSFETKEAS